MAKEDIKKGSIRAKILESIRNNFTESEQTLTNEAVKSTDLDKDIDRYTHWISNHKGVYYPGFKVREIEKVPPGVYDIRYDNNRSSWFISQQDTKMDNLLKLPIKEIDEIVKDVNHFLQRKAKFDEYGIIHKRGILMHGPPGCGKSCVISQLSELLVKNYKGLVFFATNNDELNAFISFVPDFLRSIEPNTPIIFILEDIDTLLEYGRSAQSTILNLLDGMSQCENIIYLATTNYPEKLEERILNRPSRFDRRYEISYPTAAVRKAFIEGKILEIDKKKIDVAKWVRDTKGFTMAHMKELIISVIILENDYNETIKTLRSMEKLPASVSSKKSNLGFQKVSDDEFYEN